MSGFTVYLIIFLVGVAFVLLSALFGGLSDVSIGGDGATGEPSAGGDAWGQEQVGLSPLSPLMLAILATLFGVGGMLLSSFTGLSAPVVLLATLVQSLVIYFAVYLLLQKVFVQSQASSVISSGEAIGVVATVTTRITPRVTGVVDYVAAGRRVSASARAKVTCEVGETVRIREVRGSVVQVEKLQE